MRQLWPIIQAPLLRRTPQHEERRRTSVASRRNEPTHLHCVTKITKITKKQSFPTKERLLPTTSDETAFRTSTEQHDDAPPLRHETEETIVSNKGTFVTNEETNRRTSIASRQNKPNRRTSVASRQTTHLHCVTKRRTSVASRNDAPPLRHETTSRNDAPPLRHETKRTNVQTKRRLHLHCNATNTINTIVTNATNNDEDR